MTPAQREIIEDCARRHHVSVEAILSPSRLRVFAFARQDAMYLLRRTGRWSLPRIGRVLGGRDHTTVRWGIFRHQERTGAEKIQDYAFDRPHLKRQEHTQHDP